MKLCVCVCVGMLSDMHALALLLIQALALGVRGAGWSRCHLNTVAAEQVQAPIENVRERVVAAPGLVLDSQLSAAEPLGWAQIGLVVVRLQREVPGNVGSVHGVAVGFGGAAAAVPQS